MGIYQVLPPKVTDRYLPCQDCQKWVDGISVLFFVKGPNKEKVSDIKRVDFSQKTLLQKRCKNLNFTRKINFHYCSPLIKTKNKKGLPK